jgi:hypothetical protein
MKLRQDKMKKEFQMLPNGNYEEVILPIQHECKNLNLLCRQYYHDMENLHLYIDDEQYLVKFCPICGFSTNK